MRALKATVLVLLSVLPASLLAQSGKIAGTVKDSRTGEALVSANVIIEGTNMGAATNLDGYFVILNVPPGTYSVKASMIGYAPQTVQDVRASIDLTTTLDFQLTESVFQTQEVVVVASRPIVQRDLSASTANITAQDVQNLPITQVSTVIGLQAGVRGLQIRGTNNEDEVDFVLNGLSLRDDRGNVPYTSGVSLLAVQEIQVQTGGFNAEYGNIQSGLINVVTREGSTSRYNVSFQARYAPAQRKYFGMAPNDPYSYWVRPYVDPAVCWTGTQDVTDANGNLVYQSPWDEYTRRQYPDFKGWDYVSQTLLADNDPTNDLSPTAARDVFLWQHRKSFDINKPDYDLDFGIGGPFPVFSKELGNLRFFASGRKVEEQYSIPFGGQYDETRNRYLDWSLNLKLTADVAPGMKLMIEGLNGQTQGVDQNNNGTYNIFTSASDIGSSMNRVSYIDTRLFTTDYWARSIVNRNMIGAKFTHVISNETFYEVRLQRFKSSYNTNPGALRDTTRRYLFGNDYYLDEAPFGFFPNPGGYSLNGIDGMRMAIGMSNARDTSSLTRYQGNFDLESQIDQYNHIKGGLEFVYTIDSVNYGSNDLVLQSGRTTSQWTTHPVRFAAYLQDKLEFEGMIANLGLRYELSYAGGEWYDYDPYTRAFVGAGSFGIDTLLQKSPTKKVTSLSPRLGIAFPISEDAKLFFNYGHFRSMPTPENLYLIRHETLTKGIVRIANPNLPLPKTVAYELGFEYNIYDMFLMRLAGYYRDVSDQSRLVEYIGYEEKPDYTVTTNSAYQDIRGFEATLTKNRGDWVQGFINYTYMVRSAGNFGWGIQYQNPVDQRNYEKLNPIQTRPVPQPYARANIDFSTPRDFGPTYAGMKPLADWRLNILADWQAGTYFTWVGGGSIPGVIYNIQWKDTWGVDLRLSKNLSLGGVNILLFMDINNVLNLKQMLSGGYGFTLGSDYNDYMKSLHLPSDFNKYGYGNIEGNDVPGDYRQTGVAFQPMTYFDDLSSVAAPNPRVIYYQGADRQYYQWVNGAWQLADKGLVDRTLETKAYIDMPNQDWFNFLDPRQVFFGVRVSVDL